MLTNIVSHEWILSTKILWGHMPQVIFWWVCNETQISQISTVYIFFESSTHLSRWGTKGSVCARRKVGFPEGTGLVSPVSAWASHGHGTMGSDLGILWQIISKCQWHVYLYIYYMYINMMNYNYDDIWTMRKNME